jgi:hypothetical protein
MDRRISEVARRVDYEKQDLEDLVTFFCGRESAYSFCRGRISTNLNEDFWIPDGRGWTDAAYREYFNNAPQILLEVAGIIRNYFREEGGRFWIDWRGAYSIGNDEYFVLWNRSVERTNYAAELRKELTCYGFRAYVIRRLTNPWTGSS